MYSHEAFQELSPSEKAQYRIIARESWHKDMKGCRYLNLIHPFIVKEWEMYDGLLGEINGYLVEAKNESVKIHVDYPQTSRWCRITRGYREFLDKYFSHYV